MQNLGGDRACSELRLQGGLTSHQLLRWYELGGGDMRANETSDVHSGGSLMGVGTVSKYCAKRHPISFWNFLRLTSGINNKQ